MVQELEQELTPEPRLELHELANLFPAMSDLEFEALADNINERGLLEPILTFENKIVDGRHRYRACLLKHIEPRFVEWDDDEDELVKHVLSLNLLRRHLDESQRAMIASKMATLKQGQKTIANIATLSQSAAAKIFNVSEDSIQFARNVYASADEELIDAVFTGQIAVSRANKVLKKRKLAKDEEEKNKQEGYTQNPFDDGEHYDEESGQTMRYVPGGSSVCGNSIPIITMIENESVDLIFSDPPYNADVAKWDKDFNPFWFLDQCARIVKPGGSVLIFCSHHLLKHYLVHEPKGLEFRQIIHWAKTNPPPRNQSKKQMAEGKIKSYT